MAMRAAFLTMHEHLRSFVTMDTVLLLLSQVLFFYSLLYFYSLNMIYY